MILQELYILDIIVFLYCSHLVEVSYFRGAKGKVGGGDDGGKYRRLLVHEKKRFYDQKNFKQIQVQCPGDIGRFTVKSTECKSQGPILRRAP